VAPAAVVIPVVSYPGRTLAGGSRPARTSRSAGLNGSHSLVERGTGSLAGWHARPEQGEGRLVRSNFSFLTKPVSDRAHRVPEAECSRFPTTHDMLVYGPKLAKDSELDGKRHLWHLVIDERRKKQTGNTKVDYSPGFRLSHCMFGHDGVFGADLAVNPKTGMLPISIVQGTGDAERRNSLAKTPCALSGLRSMLTSPDLLRRRLELLCPAPRAATCRLTVGTVPPRSSPSAAIATVRSWFVLARLLIASVPDGKAA
jgi:hypothetical protein